MSDDKVYNPEEIEDSPFPNEDTIESFDVSQSTSGDKINAQQIKDQKMPSRRIAQELIGTALNTKSQKILKEFEFTDSGAIKVGEYENGVSGDLKISPNGLVARNDAGTTTFAIDGTSGDAVFKGTVQAGSVISGIIQSDSVISGDVTVGGDGNANGSIAVLDENNDEKITINKDGMSVDGGEIVFNKDGMSVDGGKITISDAGITINDGKLTIKDDSDSIIVDSKGLVSINNFVSTQSTYTGNQTITGTSETDINNVTAQFTLNRTAVVLFFFNTINWVMTGAGDRCNVIIRFKIQYDGDPGWYTRATDYNIDSSVGYFNGHRYTQQYMTTMPAGTHNIKLTAQQYSTTGSPQTKIWEAGLGYIIFGK